MGSNVLFPFVEYVDGTFSVDDKYFYNLPSDKQKQILDYPLLVYVCDGTDSEKFGLVQNHQYCRRTAYRSGNYENAVYAGSWGFGCQNGIFSKTGCAADTLAGDYLKGRFYPSGVSGNCYFMGSECRGKNN